MSNLDDDEECALCLDAQRELRFRPCGHSLMCELCTLKLIARSTDMVQVSELHGAHQGGGAVPARTR